MAVMTATIHRHELDALNDAVRETMGDDCPAECIEIGWQIFDDALSHQQWLRAVDNYSRPLDRAAALADAIATIKAS